MSDQIPPHSLEAEVALLGSIFLDNDVMDDIAEIVKTPRYFYKTHHSIIFEAMVSLHDRGDEIDWVTVKEDLERRVDAGGASHLERCGGVEYLQELTEATPSSAGAEQYAEVVRDKALMRSILKMSQELKDAAQDKTIPVEEVLETMEQRALQIAGIRHSTKAQTVKQYIDNVFAEIDKMVAYREGNKGALPGVATGFRDFDNLKGGLSPGELIILAGRPGHGKSSLALNIADHACSTPNGGAVIYFSLEMSAEELLMRLLCSRAEVDLLRARMGNITALDQKRLRAEGDRLAEGNRLFIDPAYGMSTSQMRSKIRRLMKHQKVDLVIVDYVQLMKTDLKIKRHEQIGQLSRAMKTFARELDVPIIMLAQLNREIEKRRGSGRPMLSDLRESGSLEQDADVVLFIQRQNLVAPIPGIENLETEPATLYMAKNRNGPIGDTQLAFRRSCTRFETAESRYRQEFEQLAEANRREESSPEWARGYTDYTEPQRKEKENGNS